MSFNDAVVVFLVASLLLAFLMAMGAGHRGH